MSIPPVSAIKTSDDARITAINWQAWQAEESLSYGELSQWQGFFTEVANKFNLTDEFQENGIL